MFQSAYTFVCQVGGNTQACLFYEKGLYFVHCFSVIGVRKVKGGAFPFSVKVLVDITDTVFPDTGFPFIGRQCIFKDGSVSIDRSQLTGLFLDCHLFKEIFHPFVDRLRRIFIYILLSVFVEIDPTFLIYFLLIFGGIRL